MAVNLLDPNFGIQNILPPPDNEETRLPGSLPLPQTATSETGLAELFRLSTSHSLILGSLQPQVPDEELLRPDVLNRNLESAFEALTGVRHPDVRRFVRDDLGPLLEDRQLFQAYAGLMVGG
jgi:type III secretion protein X